MWRCAAYMGLVLTILLCLMTGCGKPATQQQSGKERIVSLAPNLTEIVCAVGGADQLVGRTTACNYPPDVVARVPAIGGFGAPSLEVLLALKPTRILYVDLEDQNFAQKMDAVGLTHTKVRCKTLDDIPRAVWEVGGYLHQESVAGQLAEKLTVGMAALRDEAESSTNGPLVFVEIWSDPLITAGKSSFVADLVRLAGGRNIGDEIDKDYPQVSSEWVVSRNPEIVLCMGTPQKGAGRNLVLSRAGWENIRAVRSGRVYDKLSTDVITRPGPRVLEGIEELRNCIRGKMHFSQEMQKARNSNIEIRDNRK